MHNEARSLSLAIDNAPAREMARFALPSLLTRCAVVLAVTLLVFSILNPERFMDVTHAVNKAFMQWASEAVIMVSSLILLACGAVIFSPWGNIRLGTAESTPEFSTPAWLSMLFAAGMGSGLLYWGVAEPITHFTTPPPYANVAMIEAGNARMAMVISYLHWSLHPWAIYASGALCIAYFSFCKGHPLLPSAPFRAILPRRFNLSHSAGDMVDVVCVISTLLGLAAALAVGTMQIASGTQWLGHMPDKGNLFPTYLVIVALLVITYSASASTAIGKGIKRLSEINMALTLLLAMLICCYQPVTSIFNTLIQAVGDYFRFLPELSFGTLHSPDSTQWSETWTANYFLSWLSWVPFVGIFVARISYGRTLREFMLGVILAPSLFTFLWFAILGSAALDAQLSGTRNLAADVMADTGSGLFSLLSLFPAAPFLWGLVIILVFIFLVTSADSASYVLAMMAGRGEKNPSTRSKLFWCLIIALLASAALFPENGIHSVRALFSFAGIAVFFILIAQILCLSIGLKRHKM